MLWVLIFHDSWSWRVHDSLISTSGNLPEIQCCHLSLFTSHYFYMFTCLHVAVMLQNEPHATVAWQNSRAFCRVARFGRVFSRLPIISENTLENKKDGQHAQVSKSIEKSKIGPPRAEISTFFRRRLFAKIFGFHIPYFRHVSVTF